MEQEPLIFTSKGNVPIATLTYEHSWNFSNEAVTFTEVWRDETGAIVKNNTHMYAIKGMPPIGGQQFTA
jgi:hypothetical protein